MLKKADLSKQFELVVQQEIKNYQDSLNFVLQSINELKEEIKNVHAESLENYALIHSQHNDLAAQLETIRNKQTESNKKLDNHINDVEVFKKKATDEIEIYALRSIANSNSNEFNKNCITDLKHNIDVLEDEIKGHSLTISNSFDCIQFKLAKDLKKMKDEILSMPSDSQLVRNELDEKITSHRVDVAGIMKELRIFKHDNMVTEKKIENIYTLIERLKKPEVLP